MVDMLFYILQGKKNSGFTLNSMNVASTSQVCTGVMSVLTIKEITKYEHGVVSRAYCTMFSVYFLKISQMVLRER
jgi:hypothetical protein